MQRRRRWGVGNLLKLASILGKERVWFPNRTIVAPASLTTNSKQQESRPRSKKWVFPNILAIILSTASYCCTPLNPPLGIKPKSSLPPYLTSLSVRSPFSPNLCKTHSKNVSNHHPHTTAAHKVLQLTQIDSFIILVIHEAQSIGRWEGKQIRGKTGPTLDENDPKRTVRAIPRTAAMALTLVLVLPSL